MRKLSLIFYLLIFVCPAWAAGLNDAYYGGGDVYTEYTETPVASYYAVPNDPNFVPESDFSAREDSLNYDENIIAARDAESARHPGVIFAERPAVVCRSGGCTKLNEKMTRTFLFNSLANIFMINSHSSVQICEADPFSRNCLQSGISFPTRIGVANAMLKISKASVSSVNISTGLSKATIGTTFEILVNGISSRCEPTALDIIVPINSQATLTAREFACKMTADGLTNVSMMLNLDYIDLDYGILGGYYSFGLQGTSAGGGTGYALFRLEYTNTGMKMNAVETGYNRGGRTAKSVEQAGLQTIQPGEYAVEPVK
ncbi:MAG: hypothetical protein LBO08_00915 [Rickettsiales bacterium]|jgi:hypothetical protein|nr:hypothetical protein [Rickettsiales bacterium]